MILLHFHTGADWTFAYNELYDGPIEIWENCDYCVVEHLK